MASLFGEVVVSRSSWSWLTCSLLTRCPCSWCSWDIWGSHSWSSQTQSWSKGLYSSWDSWSTLSSGVGRSCVRCGVNAGSSLVWSGVSLVAVSADRSCLICCWFKRLIVSSCVWRGVTTLSVGWLFGLAADSGTLIGAIAGLVVTSGDRIVVLWGSGWVIALD